MLLEAACKVMAAAGSNDGEAVMNTTLNSGFKLEERDQVYRTSAESDIARYHDRYFLSSLRVAGNSYSDNLQVWSRLYDTTLLVNERRQP